MKQLTQKQYGFTLLELIVVVGLLGLITSLATDYMVNETNQQRYDVTKKRLEQIRYAILGDPSRTLNGSPTISGFIADTANLPKNLRELISEPGSCSNSSYVFRLDCEGNGATWTSSYTNWKGPYLNPTGWVSGSPVYGDGWGNKGGANFGWAYVQTGLSQHIYLKSKGADLVESPDDQPEETLSIPFISSNQFAGSTVKILLTTTQEVCVQAQRDSSYSSVTTVPVNSKDFSVEFTDFNEIYGPITILIGTNTGGPICDGSRKKLDVINHPLANAAINVRL